MKRTKISNMALAGVTTLFALTACGDDVTKVEEVNATGVPVLEAGQKLSKQECGEKNEGDMLFVVDSAMVYVCDGEAWQTMKGASGKDGENGKNGTDGKNGEDGKNGSDGKNGADGKNGENGTSCTVKKSDGKSVITCKDTKGKVVSTVEVKDGENGEDGTSCTVEKKGGKSVISCTDAKGNVVTSAEVKDGENGEPCLVSDNNDGTMTITCGEDETTLYKAMCGTKPYDPAKAFCLEGVVYELCGGKSYDPALSFCSEGEIIFMCGTKKYDPAVAFCSEGEVYDLCGGKSYKPDSSYCKNGEVAEIYQCCNSGGKCKFANDWYDEREQFCYEGDIYDLCGGKSYEPDPEKQVCYEGNIVYLCGDRSYDPEKQYCAMVAEYAIFGVPVPTLKVEDFLVDPRDNQVYKTVEINEQMWMAENLNYSVNPGEQSWCAGGKYNVEIDSCSKYGRLYTWGTAKEACPEGWHLPTEDEWSTLLEYSSTETETDMSVSGKKYVGAGKALKSNSGWNEDGNGYDFYGFSVLPAGKRTPYGDFINVGDNATFWTADQTSATNEGYYVSLNNKTDYIVLSLTTSDSKNYGHSVRCIKDKAETP